MLVNGGVILRSKGQR